MDDAKIVGMAAHPEYARWAHRETNPEDVRRKHRLNGDPALGTRCFSNTLVGGKLGGGKVVTSEGATDGPFVEAKEVVGGFMIVSAESLAEAMEVARECPGVVMPGSSVEVREIHTP